MLNLQKKRLLIFKIFKIKKCTLVFGTKYISKKWIFFSSSWMKLRTIGSLKDHFSGNRKNRNLHIFLHLNRSFEQYIIYKGFHAFKKSHRN